MVGVAVNHHTNGLTNGFLCIELAALPRVEAIKLQTQFRRQERTKPLLDEIRGKIEEAPARALPASALRRACRYALTLWEKLTRFLEYSELELSNNLAENSMRPVALGRKNWIHIGSPNAGPKIAAIFSVVESCRRLKVSVREYLATILPGLADLPIQRIPELTPAACVSQSPSVPFSSRLQNSQSL